MVATDLQVQDPEDGGDQAAGDEGKDNWDLQQQDLEDGDDQGAGSEGHEVEVERAAFAEDEDREDGG